MSETRIKLCGLSRDEDIRIVNELKPDLIGFVFFPKSHRNVTPDRAEELRAKLIPGILAAGVFVDAGIEQVAELLNRGIIDVAQLHGHEGNDYIDDLRSRTGKAIFQAFKVRTKEDISRSEASHADMILLDNGKGTGECFDWGLVKTVQRPFFLAGGLNIENAADAIEQVHPYGVDVSSGIETNKVKDELKMRTFVDIVRKS